ncbi:UNVERIFIED_CONTAM: hypothetical protein GTU68_029436, partial [Idotea baltica]|nr:hypothetical protein [Idotea baltica]
ITQRLQTEFPHAKLLAHNTPPDDVTRAADEQFIQICAVKPKSEPRPELEGLEVDERILKYYSNNQVRRFVLDRPTHRGPIDKDNEFKSLWIERVLYTTECELPGILKWFEVVSQQTEQVCPPQYACETVLANIHQIRQMTAHYKTFPKKNIQPFTMLLQGSIDAAVNGGITKYQDAFFRHEYLAAYPQFAEYVINLKALMVEQAQVFERALELHGRIAPAVNQPLHKRLLEVGCRPCSRPRP